MEAQFKLNPESAEIMRVAVQSIKNQAVLSQSHRFNMSSWGTTPMVFDDNVEDTDLITVGELTSIKDASCGSSCCYFGEIALMYFDRLDPGGFIEDEVTKLLGITHGHAESLYLSDNWPEEFSEQYRNASRDGNRVEMAAALESTVEEFIERYS